MIHLIVGRQGSGKTLFLVERAYDAFKKGLTVYSNVHLNFPYTKLDYNDIVECKLKEGIVIIDEIHQLLPSRNSTSKRSREICDGFLSMVRKKRLEVYGSTQTTRKVDIRFREERDFLYICTKYYHDHGTFKEALLNYNYPTDVKIMIKLDVLEEFSQNVKTFAFIGNRFFDMFDTNQIIQVRNLKIDKKEAKT